MSDQQRESAQRIKVEVSADGLQAWLRLAPDEGTLAMEDVLAALSTAKVAIDDAVRATAQKLVESSSPGAPRPDRVLIAAGRPPREAVDGAFIWEPALEPKTSADPDEASIDYFAMSQIVTVEPETVLGRITPPTPARAGVDVYGGPLQPQTSARQPVTIELGAGVEPSASDPTQVISKIAGRVQLLNSVLSVVSVLDIRGDVDFRTGSIHSSVDVHISGNIRDNFHVQSEHAVIVGGCIEQATVEAASNIIVRNGILGHGKGLVRAGGQLVAKFCEEAYLVSGGDMSLSKEAMHSTLHTEGKLHLPRGSVIGGSAYAKEGAELAEVGKPAGPATEIGVGIDLQVLIRLRTMDEETQASRKSAAEAEERIRPLLANLKRLPRHLKEQATELFAQIEEMKHKIVENGKRHAELLAQAMPAGTPSVLISKIAHEGTRIRINQHETHFERAHAGPTRIELRKVGELLQLVAVNQLTASITPLPTAHVDARLRAKTSAPPAA